MNSTTAIYIPVNDKTGIGNILKGYITALSLTDNVIIQPNRNILLGNYDEIIEIDTNICNMDRDRFFSWRFNILKEEENDQKHLQNEFSRDEIFGGNPKFENLFSKSVTIDLFYDRSLICDRVYNRIISGINKIKWNNTIISEISKYDSQFDENTLGVSVRTWRAKHEYNIPRPYSAEIYIRAMQQMLSNTGIKKIFMSYDNMQAKNEYIDILKNYTVIEYIKPPHISELHYAVIKMLLLSKCSHFICNRISTYGELVFWFSKCKQIVIPLF